MVCSYISISLQQSSNVHLSDFFVPFSSISSKVAMYTSLTSLYSISIFHCTNVDIREGLLSNIDSFSKQICEDDKFTAVFTVYDSSLSLINVDFTENNLSSVSITRGTVTIKETVVFRGISAVCGAAFILEESTIILAETSKALFENNHASLFGGVFYVIDKLVPDISYHISDLIYLLPGSFISHTTNRMFPDRRSPPRLIFINNIAERGDVLYGGLEATGYDGVCSVSRTYQT